MPPSEALAQLATIYREHHPFVWRSLQRLGVPDVADAVHDVFLVAARRLHEFEHRSSVRTWLFAIAYRVAQSVWRDRQRQARREEPLADPDARPADGSHTSGEDSIALHQLLARLDDEKRAVFILAHLEGMTAPEIAAALDLKVPTVYSRLRLAREAMERAAAEPPTSPRRLAR